MRTIDRGPIQRLYQELRKALNMQAKVAWSVRDAAAANLALALQVDVDEMFMQLAAAGAGAELLEPLRAENRQYLQMLVKLVGSKCCVCGRDLYRPDDVPVVRDEGEVLLFHSTCAPPERDVVIE